MVEPIYVYKKICSRCNEEKLLSEFTISKGYHINTCLACKRKENTDRKKRLNNRPKVSRLENPYGNFKITRSKSK